MNILVAGLGDVGAPLAVEAAKAGHNVWAVDTYEEHAVRMELLMTPLTQHLEQPWQSLRELMHHGMFTPLWMDGETFPTHDRDGDEVPAFDAFIMTPNCMVNDAPHIRYYRFAREIRAIGKLLKKGNVVVLHCVSLHGAEMMQDAENLMWHASGLMAAEDYCLAWTGLIEGTYQEPKSQDLFVAGWETACCDSKATEVMGTMVGSVQWLHELQKATAEVV